MAGGVTTVALAHAVSAAGGFPFLAGGYKTSAALGNEIADLRSTSNGQPFGVNLFVPGEQSLSEAELLAYAERIQPEAKGYEVSLHPSLLRDDDGWEEKIQLLLDDPVPVVSFTFGLPTADHIARLAASGSRTFATVTSSAEACSAMRLGVDGVIVQGTAAGGHSAVHDPTRMPRDMETAELVREVRMAIDAPIVAAGGIDGPAAVRHLLQAGADAVAVGTLLMRTDEAGTSEVQRSYMAHPTHEETVLTRAFTGRPARALRNGFTDRHTAFAPAGYPAIHHLTSTLRRAAAEAGDTERMHLWAGTGYGSAPTGSAVEALRWLSREV